MYQVQEVNALKYNEVLIAKDLSYIPLTQVANYNKSNIYLLIKENNIKIISVLSITLQKKLNGILKYARINNGPLVFSEKIETNTLLKQIFKYLRTRGYRFTFFAPNRLIPNKELKKIGLTFKLPIKPHGTILINLEREIDDIKSSLKQKWRNTLKKSLKKTQVISLEKLEDINSILNQYQIFSEKNKFKPVSKEKCLDWLTTKNAYINLKIYKAIDYKNNSLGSIGVLYFLSTSFYLFGFSNIEGRKLHANSALLWNCIKESKESGYKTFDLGGLNETTPLGIKKFKQGLGGNHIMNDGEYFTIF